MKPLLFFVLTLVAQSLHAVDYSGLWKDDQGVLYTIHHANDMVMVGELHDEEFMRPPYEQGVMYTTDNELDLAISGRGFFILQLADGSFGYTRDGSFHLSADNTIVNGRGERLITRHNAQIPLTTEGLEPVSEPEPIAQENCSPYWGCPPPLPHPTGTLIIEPNGAIRLNDPEKKILYEVDQIQLAWIPLELINFSGYPMRYEDQQSVTVFDSGRGRQESDLYRGSISQGMLEQVLYRQKTWSGYTGAIIDDRALLKPVESFEGASPPSELSLHFKSDSEAILQRDCRPAMQIFCGSMARHWERPLAKVF